jgi:phage-related protein
MNGTVMFDGRDEVGHWNQMAAKRNEKMSAGNWQGGREYSPMPIVQ